MSLNSRTANGPPVAGYVRAVANPLLALPAVAELAALPVECRDPLRAVLRAIRADARVRAQDSWRRNKGPMAAYWKAVGVYAGHLERAIR